MFKILAKKKTETTLLKGITENQRQKQQIPEPCGPHQKENPFYQTKTPGKEILRGGNIRYLT